MSRSLSEAHASLSVDSARATLSWSRDLEETQNQILATKEDRATIQTSLSAWLARNQPCVFGKFAAAQGRINYCVLTPSLLELPDVEIRGVIQRDRLEWLRQARVGLSSAFVLLATSPALAAAEPNEALFRFCQRLASLYLLTDVTPDTIHLERVFLDVPGHPSTTLEWPAGVNVFASAGDKRWWHDHRIPAGVAFSVNSVGHLVKSSVVGNSLGDLGEKLGLSLSGAVSSKLDALPKALELAMQTIHSATKVGDRPATRLCPRPEDLPNPVYRGCPFAIRPALAEYDYRMYSGDYHTDQTLPSVYFRPNVERPSETPVQNLDFTYLFDADIGNFDYQTMGEGRPIRADTDMAPASATDNVRPAASSRSNRTRPVKRPAKDVDTYLARLVSTSRES